MFIYIIWTSLFSISLFMYGFFPIKITNNVPSNYDDIPDIINNIK